MTSFLVIFIGFFTLTECYGETHKFSFQLPANAKDGVTVAFPLVPGDLVHITASGMWSYWRGYSGDSPHWVSAMGKEYTPHNWACGSCTPYSLIGNFPNRSVGEDYTTTIEVRQDEINLLMNDETTCSPSCYNDNDGELAVEITVERCAEGGHSLVLSSHPKEGGSIEAVGGDIEKCYDAGTTLQLKAVPAEGYIFNSWYEDASGSENPLSVTLDRGKYIIAVFNRISASDPERGTVGDPVETASGSYYNSFIDFNLGGPFPLTFQRYYESTMEEKKIHDLVPPVLGNGWLHSHQTGYYRDEWDIHIVMPDTTVLWFHWDGFNWVLQEKTQIPYSLKRKGNYAYLSDPIHALVYIFHAESFDDGQLTYIMDRNENHHEYTRNSDGDIVEIKDGLGRSLEFNYVDYGQSRRLDRVGVKGADAEILFSYDADNRLTEFTDAESNTTQYTYFSNTPLMLSVTRGKGNNPYTQTYDAHNRVQTQTDAYENVTQLVYNDDGGTDITHPDASVTQQTHQNSSLLTGYKDQDGKEVTMGYDSHHKRSSVTDRMGDTTSIAYHQESGKIQSIKNNKGDTISYQYTAQVQSITNPGDDNAVDFTSGYST